MILNNSSHNNMHDIVALCPVNVTYLLSANVGKVKSVLCAPKKRIQYQISVRKKQSSRDSTFINNDEDCNAY